VSGCGELARWNMNCGIRVVWWIYSIWWTCFHDSIFIAGLQKERKGKERKGKERRYDLRISLHHASVVGK
jgi:hypothetical protein